LHARHSYLEKAFVLKEVQVPIALRLRVMRGMLARDLRMGEAAPGPEVHVNGERTSGGIEPRLSYIPRRTYTQRRLKQLLRLHRYRPVPHCYRPGRNYHLPTWISKEAKYGIPVPHEIRRHIYCRGITVPFQSGQHMTK